MITDNFFISLQKQKQIDELWSCINDQKLSSDNISIIQYAINEIPRVCGIDFLYLNIPVENLTKILTTGYNGKYSDLSKLFSSAIVTSIVDLTDEIPSYRIFAKDTIFNKMFAFFMKPRLLLFKPNKAKNIETTFSFTLPYLVDKCILSAIKFVVYASFAKHLTQFYSNDWEKVTASFVANGLGLISQVPAFSAYMDMVFECIFDVC
jgi:hypothetical protein